jgi:hypothetical protein
MKVATHSRRPFSVMFNMINDQYGLLMALHMSKYVVVGNDIYSVRTLTERITATTRSREAGSRTNLPVAFDGELSLIFSCRMTVFTVLSNSLYIRV